MSDNPFSFSCSSSSVGNSRIGIIKTPHGDIQTPNFIFCATKASIKCIPSYQVEKIGADIILSNTYHLMLRPGADSIEKLGGLHKFMHWEKPLFTDSGGYQVFAMGHGSVSEEIKKNSNRTLPQSLLKIREEGVDFKSYVDGSYVFLSPESSVDAQCKLGADLIVQFDECTPYHIDKHYTQKAMLRSGRWGQRSITRLQQWNEKRQDALHKQQAMYGVIQGGIYEDLRKESIATVESQDFFATAIGGSLGSEKKQMHDVVDMTCSLLHNKTRPLHLLGIGDIPDIFHGVRAGIDTFDCVHPTRIARHAAAIVPASIHPSRALHLRTSSYALEEIPIDLQCHLPCCKKYSRAYIHYLFKAKEFLGPYLLSVHNIGQIVRVMKDIRAALQSNSAQAFKDAQTFWVG